MCLLIKSVFVCRPSRGLIEEEESGQKSHREWREMYLKISKTTNREVSPHLKKLHTVLSNKTPRPKGRRTETPEPFRTDEVLLNTAQTERDANRRLMKQYRFLCLCTCVERSYRSYDELKREFILLTVMKILNRHRGQLTNCWRPFRSG